MVAAGITTTARARAAAMTTRMKRHDMANHTESLPTCPARVAVQGDVDYGSAGSMLACPAREVERGGG